MNRKIFLLALCFMIVSVPMLFGAYENDVLSKPMPTLELIRIVPVQALPQVLDQQRQEDSLYYCNNLAPANAVGFSGAIDWEGAMRLTPTELGAYAGWDIIAISWYHWGTTTYSQNVKVYDEGTPTTPGAVLTTEPYNTTTEEWVRVDLSNPVTISGSGDLWCSIEISQTAADFVIGVDDGPAVDGKGDWIYYSGVWDELQNLALDYNWHILAIVEQAGPVTWDFETGWQGWTNTNGLAYPLAWGVKESDLNGASWVCPDAGDSSMWIDSDAAGSGAVLVEDTVLSPVLIPNPGMDWLKYGLAYNWMGTGEYIEAGIKYFDGATWTVVPLKTYTADFDPAWDSVDVSAYAGYPNVQIYFFYTDNAGWYWYGAFDNVSIDATVYVPEHDVGCIAVASPPAGPITPGDIDVIGQIHNFGNNIETFDVTAHVYDTTAGAWTLIFDQMVTFTDFPVGGDSLHNFGACTFGPDAFFYTEIFTDLTGDADPSNDTAFVYSWTAMGLGEIIFELDVETPTGDNQLLGVEFDGTYFYVTGGGGGTDPNKVYVLDVAGNLIWTMDQPGHSTGWGWRDLAWDNAYSGPDKIDTLWASVDPNVDGFSIDLTTGTLTHHISYSGQQSPNRALAWMDDSLWFWTANFSSSVYWFDKFGNSGSASNTYAMYGAAYDTDPIDGGWVWWHSQDDPGTGWDGQISQFDPQTMSFTGLIFGYNPTTIVPTTAGGLCFYEGFMDYDVLFALVQGTPDAIIGLYVRDHIGIAEKPVEETPLVFGLNRIAPNPVSDGATVTYTTTKRGPVSLKIYNSAGRLVRTLIDSKNESAGYKTVYWDGTDDNHRSVAAGVYFYRLTAENKTASDKMIVVR